MSDKKKPEQTQADKNTSADSSNVENQAGLSTSINISSPQEAPPKKSAATDNTEKFSEKTKDKAQDKTKATSVEGQTEPSSNKNQDKSTAPVKNATATKSTTANTKKPPEKIAATHTKKNKNKISKIAVVALIIALLAILTSAYHYYWNEQQKNQYSLQLNDVVKRQLVDNQQQIAQQLSQNQQSIAQQFSQSKQASASELNALRSNLEQRVSLEKNNANTIAQLQRKIASLDQNQPSDWLLQEAEYLIRVASRSLWLEKETGTAISLLIDADLRIQQLNDPQFLALRQLIQQDIAKLQMLPKLTTDNAILKLMTLDQQVNQLPLAIFEIPDRSNNESGLELTDNANDWRENLAKTWHKFTTKYFTVTRKTGSIEPLMTPQFQLNLRENLSLKLQTTIWAASKGNSSIYLLGLNDI
jgi:uroporphyrin-3 C-methyltransferase